MRKCVLVLGMHRSGTSLLTGMLNLMGVYLGKDLMSPNEFNPKGYFENFEIYRINEGILSKLKSSWDSMEELPSGWINRKELSPYKKKLKKIISEEFKFSNVFALKDPRICLLLPLYIHILGELKIEVRYIILKRKEIEIAESLRKRDKFSLFKSFRLFKKYEYNIIKYTHDKKKIEIDFDDIITNPKKIILLLREFLGLKLKIDEKFLKIIKNFVDPKLRHYSIDNQDYIQIMKKEIDNLGLEKIGLEFNLNKKQQDTERLWNELQEKINIIINKDKYITELESNLQNKDKYITELESNLQNKDKYINELSETIFKRESDVTFLSQNLERIKHSLSWKFSQGFERIFFSFLPKNSGVKDSYLRLIYRAQNVFNKPKKIKPVFKNPMGESFSFEIFTPLIFKKCENPEVSIIIPVYNQWAYTYNCLASVLKNTSNINYEIIIVDDCSNDLTQDIGKFVKNIKVIKNNRNRGFLKNCNNAVNHALGKYVLLLNNDTIVSKDSISYLLETIKISDKYGAVGGKMILPNNTLQEAGSIIWRDGSTFGYGRGDDPLKPEYNFLREVDYCSGAFLLINKELFIKLGGFDDRYCPAYYEEADFCMRLRKRGYKIIYQPLAEIIHYEFISNKKNNCIQLQLTNRIKFYKKWKSYLLSKHVNNPQNILAARMVNYKKKILYIDDQIPNPLLGSGYPRSNYILNYLLKLDYDLTFFPMAIPYNDQVGRELEQKGVEVIYGNNELNFEEFFKERKYYYDTIFISRPHNMKKSIGIIKKYNPGVRIIYDAEAIFALREINYREIIGNPFNKKEVDEMFKKEISLCGKANVIVAVSDNEKEIFKKYISKEILVISHAAKMNATPKKFREREGILFVGGILSEEKNPNFDAVLYFVNEIFPLIQKKIKCFFYIVGTNRSEIIKNIDNPNIKIIGSINDLYDYYNDCRIFVVPTRFSAGIPLKATEAASHGLPIVMSELTRKQLGWEDGKECLSASGNREFANKVISLYKDKKLWESIRKNSLRKIEKDYNLSLMNKSIEKVFKI